MRILCFHILRMFNMCCVQKILEKYILDRWKKNINGYEGANDARSFHNYAGTSSYVWRLQMMQKFTKLITASATNARTRALCQDLFQKAKEAIEMDIGPICHNGSKDENVNTSGTVQNPTGLREKGQKNKRKVSIAKKKSNQVKARKKNAVRQATNSFTPVNISPIVFASVVSLSYNR